MITTFTANKLNSGEDWVDFRPKYLREDVGSAIYIHSSGGNAEQALNNDGSKLSFLMQRIVDAGFVGGSGDFGGPYTWGNDLAVSRIHTAKTYLDTKPGVNGKVCLVGTSMGGPAAIAYAAQYPENVSCIVLGLPVLDINYVYVNNVNGNALNISNAYGGWSESAHGPDHNPMTISSLGKIDNLPILIFNGAYDPLTSIAQTQAFANNVGESCQVVTLPYGHEGAAYAAIDHDLVESFVREHNVT